MKESMKVVILTSRGPRHSYFCRELAKNFQVEGIVVDDRYHFFDRAWAFLRLNQFNPFRLIRSLQLKKELAPYESRDRALEERFFPTAEGAPGLPGGAGAVPARGSMPRAGGRAKRGPLTKSSEREFPAGIPILWSRDPNHEETIHWVRRSSPDVLAVFGTRLMRSPLISLARAGALNLHTGLSPFYRGGHCTFWCLSEGDLAHVGVTVHHLSDRIDGGDIVYTAQPPLEPQDTVRSLECKLVRLGTERMIQALRELGQGTAPRAPQREKGKLFLSKMFTLEKRLELEKKLDAGWLRDQLQGARRPEVPA